MRRARYVILPAALSLLIGGACGGPDATSQPADAAAEVPPVSQAAASLEPEPGYSDPIEVPARTHRVGPGDTLYSLARQYYGNENQWRKIFSANANRLNDPDHLPVGIKLIIPPDGP